MSKVKSVSSRLSSSEVFKNISEKLLERNFLLFVTIVLFVLMYIAGLIVFKEKNFGNTQVFLNLLISNAGLIITSVGMTLVLIYR